jgi:hypothetical protein
MLPLEFEELAAEFGLVAELSEPLTGPDGDVMLPDGEVMVPPLLLLVEPLLGFALLDPMLPLELPAVVPLVPLS